MDGEAPLLGDHNGSRADWPPPGVLQRAVMHTENALALRKPTLNLPPPQVPLMRRYNSPARHYSAILLSLAVMGLAFVEPPTTMREFNLHNQALSVQSSALIEFCLCCLFALDVRLQLAAVGHEEFLAHGRWRKIRLLVLCQMAINTLLNVIWPSTFRLQRFLRPLLLVSELREVQQIVASVLISVPQLLRICVLLAFHIVFSATFAFLLFAGVDTCRPYNYEPTTVSPDRICSPFSKNCEDYFNTMGQSIHQMFVLLTTVSYPDVMLPAYNCHEYSALFFIYFLVVGLIFLLNLVLATVFSSFQQSTLAKTLRYIEVQKESLEAAYDTLTTLPDGEFIPLDEHSFVELLCMIRPDLSAADRLIIFRVLDYTQDGLIDKEEFLKLPEFAEMSINKKISKLGEHRTAVGRFMARADVTFLFTMLVNLNGITLIIEFSWDNDTAENVFDSLDTVLLVLFAGEIAAKVFGYGFRQFWSEPLNKIDFLAVSMGIVAQIAFGDSSDYLRGAMGLRMIRLLRSLRALKGFHVILKSTVQSLTPLLRYACVALVTYYIYAILGMEVFAGLIRNRSEASTALQDTAYFSANYWENTFNSMRASLVTLFELAVVNNWPIILDGYEAVTSQWARIFFYAWYFIIVTVVLNIVTAFLIESIHARYEANLAIVSGQDSMWVLSVRHAAKSLGHSGSENWEVTRRFNLLHTYQRLYADEIREQSDEKTCATADLSTDYNVNEFTTREEGYQRIEKRRQSTLDFQAMQSRGAGARADAGHVPRRHISTLNAMSEAADLEPDSAPLPLNFASLN